MSRRIMAGFALALLASAALAAPPPAPVFGGWDYTNNVIRPIGVDASGRIVIFNSGSGGSVFGPNAVNTAPTQPPIYIGCIFAAGGVSAGNIVGAQCDAAGHLITSISGTVAATQSGTWNIGSITTLPTISLGTSGNVIGLVGQSGAWSVGQTGTWTVQPGNTANTTAWLFTGNVTAADGTALTNALKGFDVQGLYNGATENLSRDVVGAGTAGVGIQANQPVPGSIGGATAVASQTTSNAVAKVSAGNLYGFKVTQISGAAQGFFMVHNATTVPVDGAVTPQVCVYIPPGPSSTVIDETVGGVPEKFATGISWNFSTGANCQTKTAAAPNFVAVTVQ